MEIPRENIEGSMLPPVEVMTGKYDRLFDIAVQCVTEVTGVSRGEILGTSRPDRVVMARFMTFKTVRDEFSFDNPPPLGWIAGRFRGTGKKGAGKGGKHHGSVIHGIEALCNRMVTNAREFREYCLVLELFEQRRGECIGIVVDKPFDNEVIALRLAAARITDAIEANQTYLTDVMDRLAKVELTEERRKNESLVQDKLTSNG